METRLVALKLVLDSLGVQPSIETVADRKRVQKTVYLGQLTGVDMGYRFGWYLKGPYSPALARDYYSLAEAIKSGDRDHEKMELQSSIVKQLHRALPLMKVQSGISLSQEDWLELVSSVHYLQKIGKSTRQKSIAILMKEKPRLARYFENAERSLRHVGLLP